MPRERSTLTLTLELSTNLQASHTRERCPTIRFMESSATGQRQLVSLRSDVEKPRLELPDAAIREIDADDVFSRVIDEPAWIAEPARVLAPNGLIHLTVPASGPLAWLDARNAYRYTVDILGRGNSPDSTYPTGWNRHYTASDIRVMFEDAGFTDIAITRVGIGLAEPVQMAGLLVGNFLLGKRDTELRLHPLRRRMERLDTRIGMPGIGVHLAITARRARAGPDDPADDSAPANNPAPEVDHE